MVVGGVGYFLAALLGSLRTGRGPSNWPYLCLALFRDSFWMYREVKGNKNPSFDDCRSAPLWPCLRAPPRILYFCFCWLGLMGAVSFTAAITSSMLHRRGFLASLARRHLLYMPIDWLIDAPVVQSIAPIMIRDDY